MLQRIDSPSVITSVASAAVKSDIWSTQWPSNPGFQSKAIGIQETDLFSARSLSSVTPILTHQCKLEGDCPSDAESDKAPYNDLERAVDEDSLIEQ
jgi:hypothetical protein